MQRAEVLCRDLDQVLLTQILKEERRALFTHCYGHALNLAVSDTVCSILKSCDDTVNATSEILKLLSKRDTMLKKHQTPETPGF